MKALSRVLIAAVLVATHLAVVGLRGQTVSLGGGHAHSHTHADRHSHGLAHADHHHHHDHHDEPAPADPHSHDGQDTHVHLTLDGWARMSARVAVELPQPTVLMAPPAVVVADERVAMGPLPIPYLAIGPWQPPDGELAALRGIRLHV